VNQSNQGVLDRQIDRPWEIFFYFVVAIVLSSAALCSAPATRAAESSKPDTGDSCILVPGTSSKRQRVLSFPKDYSLGEIVVSPYPPKGRDQEMRGAAKGTIVVAAGKMVKFIPAAHFYKNPSIVNTMAPDSFDSILVAAVSLDNSEEGMCDRALSYVGHLKGLVELSLDRSEATDKGAMHAAELPNLQRITAQQAALEGKCFKQFAALKQLQSLNLPRNCLKDENLQYLGLLPQLKCLSISHCGISDAGVKYLANCKNLMTLNLENNPKITDQSIKYLLSLKKLRYLRIADTSITAKGVLPLKGLPLIWLNLPSKNISPSQLKDIQKAMPGVGVVATTDGQRHVDEDTEAIFAPMH
jgi:hypothetical protein